MKNIIFYFSGTGNCLKAAKSIVKEFGDGKIVSMAKPGKYELTEQYDTVGFVFPTYFMGVPKRVFEFVTNLNLANSKNAYYYVISTCGGFADIAIAQMYKLIRDVHGIKVNYSKGLRMFSNYVIMYKMSKNVEKITRKSNEKLVSLINSIKKRKTNKVNGFLKILASSKPAKDVSRMDTDYNVNDNCTGCGICEEVCPVKNIKLIDKKPRFNHTCEQCVACIQFCPQRAINYKNVTQNRGRYTHPEIDYRELSKCNNS